MRSVDYFPIFIKSTHAKGYTKSVRREPEMKFRYTDLKSNAFYQCYSINTFKRITEKVLSHPSLKMEYPLIVRNLLI